MRHFGPTDRDNRTGQSGPPSKLVTNIPIRPNRNGPFHLIYQPKFPKFWVEWKAPFVYRIFSVLAPPPRGYFFFTFQFIPSNCSKRFCQTPFKISFIVNLPRMFKWPKRQCIPNISFFTHVQKNSPTRPICLVTGRFAASSSRFVAIDFLHKTVLKKLRMNYKRVILRS